MSVPYPENEYLLLLGKVGYSVSYLEWVVLGDLPSIPNLPTELSIDRLAGLTTGQVAKALTKETVVSQVRDSDVVDWLTAAAAHLEAVAVARNAVLHARPATSDKGDQRLYRWEPRRNEFFIIEIEILTDLIDDIDRRLADLAAIRLV